MSILIKGMEMLEEGAYSCELGVIDKNTAVLTFLTPIDEPQISYKLISIPPHGRLIDADVVARDLQEMCDDIENSFPYMDKNDALMIERGIQWARQYILNLSATIIEAEEGVEKNG